MIRNLLATTAIAALLTSGAIAQTTTPTAPAGDPAMNGQSQQQEMTIRAEGNLASNIMGQAVYNSTGEDAENIGSVSDMVITPEGEVQAIVVGVGGFLGIGQKEVALEYNLVEWADQNGERQLVVETTAEALEAQEEFDRSAYEPMPADAQVSETEPAGEEDLANAPTQEQGAEGGADQTAQAPDEQPDETGIAVAPQGDEPAPGDTTASAPTDGAAGQPSDEGTATAESDQEMTDQQDTAAQDTGNGANQDQQAQSDQPATDQTQTGAIDRSSLQEATPDQIQAENLTGATVYGANEENVGDINDVILTPEGEVDAVIVDVGGFLGMGEKQVAMSIDNLAFMTDENGDLYLYTEFTQEQLEAQPEYDEASYAEQRDEMRLQAQ